MPSASEAAIYLEFSQTLVAMAALTDSGDHTKFTSGVKYWSGARGFEPTILPNGIRTGGTVTGTAVNSQVSVAELECNINGVIHTEPTALLTVARPADAKVKISSVTINAALTLVMVAGTDGDTFSETRAAAGGPPLIPVDSIEIAQVRLDDETASVIAADEIKQVPGTHMELAGYPVEQMDSELGTVTMSAALPLIHTGVVAKSIFAEFYTAEFIKIDRADAYQPPTTTNSVTSTPTYDGPVGSSSESLNGGSFTVLLNDGIGDPIMKKLNDMLWVKFYPKKTVTSRYWIVQGKLGATIAYPSAANISGAFTITPDKAATAIGGL